MSSSGVRPKLRVRVLVIDDERLIVDMIRRVLRDHDVTGITDPVEALAKIAEGESYDVIFCDLMMPQMSGFEVHERLSTLAPHLVERLVFLSGGVFSQRAREFLASIGNRRLDKPVAPGVLRGIVDEAGIATGRTRR